MGIGHLDAVGVAAIGVAVRAAAAAATAGDGALSSFFGGGAASDSTMWRGGGGTAPKPRWSKCRMAPSTPPCSVNMC